MSTAKSGDKVKVEFTGKLEDGTVFDSTENRQPLEFVLGQDQLLTGFQQAVVGMSPGESKSIVLDPENAFGRRQDAMIVTVDRSQLPSGMQPSVGQTLQVQQPEGSTVRTTVTEVTDDAVTLDANHPLAGRTLSFDLSLVEIV